MYEFISYLYISCDTYLIRFTFCTAYNIYDSSVSTFISNISCINILDGINDLIDYKCYIL